MKALIAILMILVAFWGGKQIYNKWTEYEPPKERRTFADDYLTEDRLVHNSQSSNESQPAPGRQSIPSAQAPVRTTSFEGLPPALASSLAEAKRAGNQSVKVWIQKNRGKVKDPALADIELDYVVAVGRENFVEAKRAYARVAERIDASSPVYARLKSLEAAYK